MSADFTGGFWYEVSDEQLARFARMSTRERLEWVDAARCLPWVLVLPKRRNARNGCGAACPLWSAWRLLQPKGERHE